MLASSFVSIRYFFQPINTRGFLKHEPQIDVRYCPPVFTFVSPIAVKTVVAGAVTLITGQMAHQPKANEMESEKMFVRSFIFPV